MTPGRCIKIYRIQHCISLFTISNTTHISEETLRNIEDDKERADGGILYNIAIGMGTNIFSLLSLPPSPCHCEKDARSILRPYLWRLAHEQGERLKQRREKLGLSAKQVANLLGKSPTIIRDYESGVYMFIKPTILSGFSDVLKCTPDWILGNEIPSCIEKSGPIIESSNTSVESLRLNAQKKVLCQKLLDGIREKELEMVFKDRYGFEAWELLKKGNLDVSAGALEDIQNWMRVGQ